MWPVAGGRPRRAPLPRGALRVRIGLAVSGDGLVAAFQDGEKSLQFVDVRSGKLLSRIEQEDGGRGALSADGKIFAARSASGPIILWDVRSGKLVRQLAWPDAHGPWCLAFSRDGRALAGGSPGGAVHVIDAMSGGLLTEINGPEKGSTCIAFSPDGRTLASGSVDCVVRLWDTATGKQRVALEGHRGPVRVLCYSADGKRLASGSDDTTALVWGLAGHPRWAGERPTAAELAGLWDDLAGEDAARAYRAVQQLALAPEAAVPFLAARLRAVAVADPKGAPKLSAERLRQLRALEALEHAGTPAAQQALARLAKGHPPRG